jgi:Zn finger protein HypA/HybF involved in hydrogenase expression
MNSSSSSRQLWCECTNCTERWTDDGLGVAAIRCPDCGSKNVEISGPGVDEGVESVVHEAAPRDCNRRGHGHREDPR